MQTELACLHAALSKGAGGGGETAHTGVIKATNGHMCKLYPRKLVRVCSRKTLAQTNTHPGKQPLEPVADAYSVTVATA